MTLICNVVMSQANHKDRSKKHKRMKAKKIAYITDALELTPAESEKFWPLYNELKQELYVLYEERHIDDVISGDVNNPIEKYIEVSEKEALAILNKSLQLDKKEIDLKEKYNAKFLEVIPAKKLVKLRGIERKFRRDILSSIRDRYTSRDKRKS